ncbi:MAG: MBOAT family O-acyltransferase [Suilimivivens sp.]
MLFSGIPFLYYFLPVVLALYFAVPGRFKNTVLLLSSLAFYAWGEPKYVLLMMVSVPVGFFAGILMDSCAGEKTAKLVLAGSAVIHLGLLTFFKYGNFLITNWNTLTGFSVPLLKVALPIGISFYTFQILSYEIDVYRGKVAAQKNLISLAAYISMFPQLIAGPIVRYADINRELDGRAHSAENFAPGIRRFVIGLSKKILLANVLGELCDTFQSSGDKSVLFYWLFAISYTLQIYFDFSGYSDMAIGLGRIFGFHFPENFCYPYMAKSITQFWRRWHISLSSWFRDYVYIPLGGNRVSKTRWLFNLFVVWILTGLWHGASWNFVIWGLFFAVLLVVEKMWLLKHLEKSRVLCHVYVLLAVVFSFVIFYGTDLEDVLACLGGMIGLNGVPLLSEEFIYYLKSYAVVLLLGMAGATPLLKNLTDKFRKNTVGEKTLNLLEPFLLIGLLLLNTAYLVDSSFNPFLYFRF